MLQHLTLSGRTRWIALALVLLLALAWMAVMAWRAPRAEALLVQSGPLLRTLQFSARVATLSRVEIGSTVTGRVAQVQVREGAQVRRGEVLVRLETEELRAAEAQAVAAERQADATLQAARATLARAEQLVRQNFYSVAQLDEAKRALDVALAQQGAARAAVTAAHARLEQTRIEAPADARVLARMVEPGQIVQPGKALLNLALAGPTQLVAQVDERFLDQLQVGQTATVVADAFAGERFAARVQSIAPLVDAQRGAVEVKLGLLQEAPAFLREDMTLSVEVETARREQALALPLAVLRQPTGDTARVLVAVDGVVQERTLRLGLHTLAAAEVLDGLRIGDAVLIGSAFKIGQRVTVLVVPWQPTLRAAPRDEASGSAGSALTNAMGR
ncbi:MAG: efflux RND transporter periplasmic adaptor subunit [Hylemonella sp.]|uniref:efflux RND transporter periplasmic adaptor subunit n=1 Tax=Hylemonella sp. TaxID=2066020 RepID=UPI0022C212B9|nr:efflux RND transporter periplasmic adaptor subunit [Hylemonella sp.]MCZ8252549.1 efflux RND transporter periplasmic adaptor subunit [Hylemonella sp.]